MFYYDDRLVSFLKELKLQVRLPSMQFRNLILIRNECNIDKDRIIELVRRKFNLNEHQARWALTDADYFYFHIDEQAVKMVTQIN